MNEYGNLEDALEPGSFFSRLNKKQRRIIGGGVALSGVVAASLAITAALSSPTPAAGCHGEPTPTATATKPGNPSGASFTTKFSGTCDGLIGIVENTGDGTSPGGEDFHLYRKRHYDDGEHGILDPLDPGDYIEVTMEYQGNGTYFWKVHRPFGHPGPEYIVNKLKLNLNCETPTPTQEPPTETPELPTETPVPSETPTETPVPSETPTETPVPSETPTETPVPSSTPTETPELPTETPTPTNTPVTPTNTPESPTPTSTPVGLRYILFEKNWYDANGNPMPWLPPVEDFLILAESNHGTAACIYADLDNDGTLEFDELACLYDNDDPASDVLGLWVPLGEGYTVSEEGLPVNFDPEDGVGGFTNGDGYCQPDPEGVPEHCVHVVKNKDPIYVPTPTPTPVTPTPTNTPVTPTNTPESPTPTPVTPTNTPESPTPTPTNTPVTPTTTPETPDPTPTNTPETPDPTPTTVYETSPTPTLPSQPGGAPLDYTNIINSGDNLLSGILIGGGVAVLTAGLGYGLWSYNRRRRKGEPSTLIYTNPTQLHPRKGKGSQWEPVVLPAEDE